MTTQPVHPGTSPLRRLCSLEAWLGLLLVLTFLSGGGSQDQGLLQVLPQLLALPILMVAILKMRGEPNHPLRRAAMVVVLLIAAIPALQLLPIPEWLRNTSPARVGLMRDLEAAGVGHPRSWTLSPRATEQALWWLMPGLAAFFSALSLPDAAHRRVMTLMVFMILFSAGLGFIHSGVGQGSVLNPHPQWPPAFAGVFANPNHQASALIVGIVLALGLWLENARADLHGQWQHWALTGCALVLLIALVQADSRAGLLLVGPAVAGVLIGTGILKLRTAGATPLSRAAMIVAMVVISVCGYLALRWFQLDMSEGARWPMALATKGLAIELWPLGAGMGSFVPWFEQAGPDALMLREYINHAHNEYVQWWLEGGLAALLVLAAVLVLLVLVFRALLRRRSNASGLSAWVSVMVLLAASLVDYPLRTAALMVFGACLASIAVAQASRNPR